MEPSKHNLTKFTLDIWQNNYSQNCQTLEKSLPAEIVEKWRHPDVTLQSAKGTVARMIDEGIFKRVTIKGELMPTAEGWRWLREVQYK